MEYSLSQIAQICGGSLIGPDRIVSEVLTDSRHSGGGGESLFVAMCGARHDSHTFVVAMLRRGVVSFLVEDRRAVTSGASFVVVPNSLEALQRLASHYRTTLRGEVIAITGSNGKTLVKEWISQAYNDSGRLFRSPRSYNSQLGVALSILMASVDDEILLLEAGISQVGEMERLEAMIRPDMVIFTSIGDAHQEGFESFEQKIYEKMILARSAKRIIYHSEYSPLTDYISLHPPKGEVIDASTYRGGTFCDTTSRRNSSLVEATLHSIGCSQFDIDSFQPVAMRLEVKEGINDSIILNDSYNSDVNSLSIALDYLNEVAAGRERTLILSPILQSGVSDEELYRAVAKVVASSGVERLICVGDQIASYSELFECSADFYSSTEELLVHLTLDDYASRAILLKGNRNSRFERVSHRLERKSHTTSLEVNLESMLHNLNYFRSKIRPSTKLIAMVKASSYGLGDYEIAQLLESQGVEYLAVAFVDEGVLLRERGITMPIIVLNADEDSFEQMIQMQLEPEIYSQRSLSLFVEALERNGEVSYPIHIKIDSGMHRLGFDSSSIGTLLETLPTIGARCRVASIFTHLCCADMAERDEFTRSQVAIFNRLSGQIIERLGYRPMLHLAASAAIERLPEVQADACRLGIGLYGYGEGASSLEIVATLKTRIVQIKHLKAGESIGYGGATILERDSVIATIPIGYADGLDRHLSCGGWSMVVGEGRAPIVGRVCMDSSMIDITDIEGVKEGDQVTIFSPLPGNTAQDMADKLGTIPYEILTSISKRVKRVYLK